MNEQSGILRPIFILADSFRPFSEGLSPLAKETGQAHFSCGHPKAPPNTGRKGPSKGGAVRCLRCHKEAQRRWLARGQHRANAYRFNREARRKNPDKWHAQDRKGHLLWAFGITIHQFEKMKADQAGVCKLCFFPPFYRNRPSHKQLSVDHDPVTGRVRGLLCPSCNGRLISHRRDPALFRRAAEYLESTFDGRKI